MNTLKVLIALTATVGVLTAGGATFSNDFGASASTNFASVQNTTIGADSEYITLSSHQAATLVDPNLPLECNPSDPFFATFSDGTPNLDAQYAACIEFYGIKTYAEAPIWVQDLQKRGFLN